MKIQDEDIELSFKIKFKLLLDQKTFMFLIEQFRIADGKIHSFLLLQGEKMKNQYNASNSNKPHLDTSTSSNKASHNHDKQMLKLYSSERLTHADLPSHSAGHTNTEVSASQLYFNLNSSLDGLLSKIESIKQEHVTQQKAPKPIKKFNMDVSGFPMPNLTHTDHFLGKGPIPPNFIKPREKKQHHEQYFPPSKLTQVQSEDNKSVSPPTQTHSSKNISVNNFKKYEEVEMKIDAPSIQIISHPEEKQKQKTFTKPMFSKGLMSMPNINLKVSMEMSDQQYQESSHTSELDKIIEKQAQQCILVKKSIMFGDICSLKDFQLGKNIGSGKFGDVHICRHKATGAMYALKKIFKSTILEYNMVTQFTRELKIHYKLDHPNIIKLYTHFDDEYHIFLLMEYAEGGILLEKLKCSEDMVSKYVDQTIDAVQYLHKLKIAHRDIKPQNIVMQFNDVIKLCDFGWASFYENEMKTTFCGTLDYLSPEMKQGGQYDNSVDIWSVGVLTYELLTGNPPYRKELMLSMKNGVGPTKPGSRKVNWSVNYPSFMSPLAQSFIRNLLKENPQQRATLRFCSTHTFIRKYKQNIQELPLYLEFKHILEDATPTGFKQVSSANFLQPTWVPNNFKSANSFNSAFNNLNI